MMKLKRPTLVSSHFLTRPYKDAHLKWAILKLVAHEPKPIHSDRVLDPESASPEGNADVPESLIQTVVVTPPPSLTKEALLKAASKTDVVSKRETENETGNCDRASTNTSHKEDKAAQQSHEGALNVLVVEDTLINQKVAKMMLEKIGVVVDIVENGQLAVDIYQEKRFDLILMDCQMPVMDGFEATRQIREIEKQTGGFTPIVALTANVVKEEKEKCFAAGMNDFVSKPVSLPILKQKLEQHAPLPVS